MKTIILLLLSSISLLAVDSIYTWGYGEDIYEMLMSLRHLVSGMGYIEQSAIAVALVVMIYKLFKGASTFDSFFSPLLFIVVVTGMMFGVTKTYMIEDEVSGYTHTINDVPLGSGEPLSIFSTLERILGKGMEAAFSTPNSLHFTEAGYGFGMDVNLKTMRVRPIDPYLIRTFNEYLDNCIAPDIIIGATKEADILKSTDLLTDLRISGWQTLAYSDSYPTGREMSCQDAYDNYIAPSVIVDTLALKNKLANSMGLTNAKLDNGMEAMSNILYGATKSSEAQIQQAVLKNMFDEGLVYYAQINGIDMAALATGKALMDNTTKSQWLLAGLAAKEYLPILKSSLTIILGAITPFIILLAVATLQLQYIKTIIYIYLTLAMMTPILTVLNHMMYVRMERSVSPYLTADGGFTMLNAVQLSSDLTNYLNWLGFLGTLAPLIAYSIVKGSEQGFVHMFNALGGATGGGISAGANQMGTGNYSHGNASSGNININDQHGMHSAIGSNMKTNNIGHAGMQKEDVTTGEGTYTKRSMQSGSSVTTDNNGEIVNYDNPHIKATAVGATNSSLNRAESRLESATEQFADTIGSSMGSQFMSAHSANEMDSFSQSMGLSSGSSKALSSAVSQSKAEALKESFSQDELMNFKKEASSHAGIDLKSDEQLFGWIAEKVSGLSVDAGGKVNVSSSDGSSFSFQTSGETAKSLQENFNNNLSKELRENEGLTKDLATQIVTQDAYSNTEAYNQAKNYSNTLSEVEQLQHQKSFIESTGHNINRDLGQPLIKEIINSNDDLKGLVQQGYEDRAYHLADQIIMEGGRGTNPIATAQVNSAFQKVTGGWDLGEMESRIAKETGSIPDSLGVSSGIISGRSSIGADEASILASKSGLKTGDDNLNSYNNSSDEFIKDAQEKMSEFESSNKDRALARDVYAGKGDVMKSFITAQDDGVIPINNELKMLAGHNIEPGANNKNIRSRDDEVTGAWSNRPEATQQNPLSTNQLNTKDIVRDIDDLKTLIEDKKFEPGSRAHDILYGNERS